MRTPSQFPSPTVLRSIPLLAYLHPFPQVSVQSETGIPLTKMLSEVIVVVPRKCLAQNHHNIFLQTRRHADNLFRWSSLLPDVDIYTWKWNTTCIYAVLSLDKDKSQPGPTFPPKIPGSKQSVESTGSQTDNYLFYNLPSLHLQSNNFFKLIFNRQLICQ